MRRAAVTALVAGVIVGTFLAALPYAENEACLGFAVESRGGADGSAGGWPYGTRCEWTDNGAEAGSFAPGVPETIGWIVAASMLFAAALLKRSGAARGAALAAGLLAFVGWGWHYGGEFVPVAFFVLMFGWLGVYGADRVLRGGGSRVGSLLTAVILTPAVVFAGLLPGFFDLPRLGIVLGLLAGAAVTALRPFSPEPVPAR